MIKRLIMLFTFIIGQSLSAGETQSINQLALEYLRGEKHAAIPFEKDSPFYPPLLISKTLRESKSKDPKHVIATLESLLAQGQFKGDLIEKKFQVGTLKSFRFWREALYLVLGRAYYESGDYKKALLYYQAIPPEGPFSVLAALEKAWAQIALEDYPRARQAFSALSEEGPLAHEIILLDAFIMVKESRHEEALERLINIHPGKDWNFAGLLRLVRAQARLASYVKKYKNFNFDTKINILNAVIADVEQAKKKWHDGEVSFLAAETYWHKASAYRLEEPVKYEKEIKNNLARALNWMAPYVEKSIKTGKAALHEEAMFFSVALLWEQEKFNEAARRLSFHPTLFPQGEYLEDAYQMLGDHYFDKSDFQQAIRWYRQLAGQVTESKITYGVYKAAWSFYNLDQKWKALRHFERLIVHYRKDPGRESKTALKKESWRDFLTVMSELMPAEEAFLELNFIGLKDAELPNAKTELGANYQAIGRYDQASAVWSHLLERHPQHKQSPQWLISLNRAYLSMGKRLKMAEISDKYLPQVLKLPIDRKKFDKEWGLLLLTVHREARKSDNRDDWKATDAFYNIFEKHLQHSSFTDPWYHGAQRWERRQKNYQAIKWYQAAAADRSFKLADDAAESVLRLANTLNDELSLKEEKSEHKNEYIRLGEAAKWYLEHKKSSPQAALAEFIYQEALYYQGNVQAAFGRLENNFKASKDLNRVWNQYIEANRRLYRVKNWEHAHQLAARIYRSSERLERQKRTQLHKIYQETAFQKALGLEKSGELEDIVSWYDKSAAPLGSHADFKLRLKAWHNKLIYLAGEKAYPRFNSEWEKLQKSFAIPYRKGSQLAFEERNLWLNIHKARIKVSLGEKRFHKQALSLIATSHFAEDAEVRDGMLWDALLLLGSYGDKNNFEKTFKQLKEMNSPLLNEHDRQLALSRMWFYLGEYQKAWHTIRARPKAAAQGPLVALLINDLYFHGDRKTRKQIDSALLASEQHLKGQVVLLGMWSFLHRHKFNEITQQWDTSSKLKLSNADDFDDPVEALQAKLKDVSRILRAYVSDKKKISDSIVIHHPQHATRALCAAPKRTEKARQSLIALIKEPLKSQQWQAFVDKVDEKALELQQVLAKEQGLCDQSQKASRYYADAAEDPQESARLQANLSRELEKLEGTPEDALKRVHTYLEKKSPARAEYYIASLKDPDKKALGLMLLRLYLNDRWNASLVKKSIKKWPAHYANELAEQWLKGKPLRYPAGTQE